jgi:hypothetical protein
MQQLLRCARMQRENQIHSMGSQLPFAAPNVNVRSGWKTSPHIICVLKPCLHKKYANTLIQQSK